MAVDGNGQDIAASPEDVLCSIAMVEVHVEDGDLARLRQKQPARTVMPWRGRVLLRIGKTYGETDFRTPIVPHTRSR
jgi:hypothetical protein